MLVMLMSDENNDNDTTSTNDNNDDNNRLIGNVSCITAINTMYCLEVGVACFLLLFRCVPLQQ